MQFDGNELEKDDNNKPLEDDDNGAISWEDLLNMDEEDDLSSLIVNSDNDKKSDSEEKSNISDFDISTLSNEEVLSENKEKFNLNEAAANYVNSLDKSDASVSENLAENENIETVSEEKNDSEEDILNVLAENDSLASDTEPISLDEDLSDVVDDELLSLLDVKNDSPSSYTESNLVDILDFGNKEEKQEEVQDEPKEPVSNLLDDIKNEVEIEPVVREIEEEPEENKAEIIQDVEDVEPPIIQKPKSNKKLVLAVSLGLVGLFAVIVILLYFLFPNLAGNSNSDDLMTQDNTNYSMPQETTGDAIEMQKQTQELMDKLENKADNKKENKEKKVVVAIQASGRANPFVPSSLFNEDGSLAMGADLSLPPDVDVNSPEAVAARKLFSISVSGIMFDPSSPSAILKFDGNDYFVQKGDKIDTYTVKQITKDYVQIANGANVYKAYVGEAFSIGEIPQSRQMKYTGKTRQYISADDIEISTK